MYTFLAMGILLALILWVFQQRPLTLMRTVVLIVLALGVMVIVYLSSSSRFLGSEPWYNQTPYRELSLYLIMMAGMAARYMHNAIENRQEKIAILKRELAKEGKKLDKKPGLEFDLLDFSLPFFVSVITFGMLISQLEERNLTITTLTISFQTGFFWQTLLKRKLATHSVR